MPTTRKAAQRKPAPEEEYDPADTPPTTAEEAEAIADLEDESGTDPELPPAGDAETAEKDEQFWGEAEERLKAKLGKTYPDTWPGVTKESAPGAWIMGVVSGFNPAAMTRMGPVAVVNIVDPQGKEWSIWLWHDVLRHAFERMQVAKGELIAVHFKGEVHPEGGGNSYRDYELVVDRDESRGEIDWRKVAEKYGDIEFQDGDRYALSNGADDDGVPF